MSNAKRQPTIDDIEAAFWTALAKRMTTPKDRRKGEGVTGADINAELDAMGFAPPEAA